MLEENWKYNRLPSNAVDFAKRLWKKLTRYHSIRCTDLFIFNVEDILWQDRLFGLFDLVLFVFRML